MGLIRDPQLIFDKMTKGGFRFYKVYDGDGKTCIDMNMDTDKTAEEAAADLQNTLNNFDGLVTVEIFKKHGTETAKGGDTQNGKLKFTLKVGNAVGTSTGINGNGGGGSFGGNMEMYFNLMNQLNDARILQMQKDFEWQRKYDALVNLTATATPENKLLGSLIKKIDTLDFGAKPKQVHPQRPINGTPEATETPKQLVKKPMTEEQSKTLNLAIHALMENDPNFIENIVKLAKLAKEDPQVYAIAINKLNALS